MQVDAYCIAERFQGVHELPGARNNHFVMAMLRLDNSWPKSDEVPWCSAFVNFVAFVLGLPRSRSLRARSWLLQGQPVPLPAIRRGFDIVVLRRGGGRQPGPDVIDAPGHVGFFSEARDGRVWILGGNQSDAVTVAPYPIERILGVRRLWG